VPGLDCCLFLAVPDALAPTFAGSWSLLGYVGLGPGQELIPYFLSLLAFAATALLAILQWPLLALRRRLSRARGSQGEERKNDSTATIPESFEEGTRDLP
jgi:hypothetical protein